jgi:hypothetical protein
MTAEPLSTSLRFGSNTSDVDTIEISSLEKLTMTPHLRMYLSASFRIFFHEKLTQLIKKFSEFNGT